MSPKVSRENILYTRTTVDGAPTLVPGVELSLPSELGDHKITVPQEVARLGGVPAVVGYLHVKGLFVAMRNHLHRPEKS